MISLYPTQTSGSSSRGSIRLYPSTPANTLPSSSPKAAPISQITKPVTSKSTGGAPQVEAMNPALNLPLSKGNSTPIKSSYGASNIEDNYSGKPLLTYENPATQSSQLLSNRVAPDFDPTVPQKIDRTVLHNDRMPLAASEAYRKITGALPNEDLDHLISLEAGGSNEPSNLSPEKLKTSGSQPSLTLENLTAKQIATGKISYIQGQINLARAKGIQLPDDSGYSSSAHPLASSYRIPPPTNAPLEQPLKFAPSSSGSTTNSDVNFKNPGLSSNISIGSKTAPLDMGAVKGVIDKEVGVNWATHPVQSFKNLVSNTGKAIDTAVQGLISNAVQFKSDVLSNTNRTEAEKVASTLNLLHSMANLIFLPVSETYSIASQLPVIKPAADAIGVVFSAAGKVVSFSADKLLDALPLRAADREALRAPIENVASLAGQITLGGFIYEKLTSTMEAKGTITPEDIKATVKEAEQHVEDIKALPAPKESPKLNAAEQPLLEAPKRQSKAVKGITAASKPGNTPTEGDLGAGTEPKSPSEEIVQPKTRVTSLKPIEGTGETKIRGLSEGVEAKAIQNKLTDSFGDLPDYKTVNIKEQAQKASDLISKDYETARAIAIGEKSAPKGVVPEAVYIAVENRAIAEGDIQTLKDLANSKLATEATTMGQRIRTLAERDPESPSIKIKEIQEAREKAVSQRAKKSVIEAKEDVVKQVKEHIKKASARPRDWKSFVESITC